MSNPHTADEIDAAAASAHDKFHITPAEWCPACQATKERPMRNTYEILITVVTSTSRNGIEADARWLADLMTTDDAEFRQEAWVESVERIYPTRNASRREASEDTRTWADWDFLRIDGIKILDADGFDRQAPDFFTRLYTRDEFLRRRNRCTIISALGNERNRPGGHTPS